MPISIESPNPQNYIVGKGRVYFKPDGKPGDILDYPVGNVTEFELTPNIETLDHFSSMEGVRQKDRSDVIESGLSARMVMEEWTPQNLALMLLGTPDITNPANVKIDILSVNKIRGHLRYVGTNQSGPKWTFDLPAVEFSPSGALNPISDDWGNMEVTGEVVVTGGSFGEASADFSVSAAPTNTLVPSIAGIAQDGQTLTAIPGTWTGSPVLTYQWQKDSGSGFADIVGATASTYAVVTADVGEPIRVVVTGTNGTGNAVANSAPTADVITA